MIYSETVKIFYFDVEGIEDSWTANRKICMHRKSLKNSWNFWSTKIEDFHKLWFSSGFKNERYIRFIMTEDDLINNSLNQFDQVVAEIENSIIWEVHGKGIKSSWNPNPEKRTCDACDFRTFCKKSESTKNVLTVP